MPHPNSLPTSGWLVDLTPEQRQGLLGATLTVTSGARGNTGLVIKVADEALHLFRPDTEVPFFYPVSSTHFNRDPGKRLRPALARCLAAEVAFEARIAAMADPESSGTARFDYDKALSAQEEDRLGFYGDLLKEAAHELFAPAPVL
ncbi:hypothetical protein [Streptomyces sp. Midd1]|uniref:hypothetical protein n=1 Tax=Streptomyces sp. Midd3 TaxID=3161191 RepID=UPI0034DB77E8